MIIGPHICIRFSYFRIWLEVWMLEKKCECDALTIAPYLSMLLNVFAVSGHHLQVNTHTYLLRSSLSVLFEHSFKDGRPTLSVWSAL